MENVKTLVVPGGFIKGVIMLGIISELEDLKLLEDVTEYIGTSVGAVISLLLSIKYNSREILEFVNGYLIKDVQDAVVKSIKEFGSQKFFMDNSFIVEHIKKMIENKNLDPDMTLSDHFNLTNKIISCTSHVIDMKSENSETKFLSYHTQPNLRCIDALKMSFSIPFLFDIIEINDSLYIDGGIKTNVSLCRIKMI